MKFFFCETCGKRLTDGDLAAGQGRDKKLRGVFCSACAQGVMTLETLPLSEREARKVVASEAAADRGARSSEQLPAGARAQPRAGARPGAYGYTPPKAKVGAGTWLGTAVAGGVLLALGVLLLAGGGTTPRAQPRAPADGSLAAAAETKTEPIAAPPAQPAPARPPEPASPPAEAGSSAPDLDRHAAAAFESLSRFEGLAPDDWDGRLARIEAFLKEHGGAVLPAARARALRSEFLARKHHLEFRVPQHKESSTAPAPAAPAAAGGSVVALFNGRDLEGFGAGAERWQVRDGALYTNASDGKANMLFRFNCLPKDFDLSARVSTREGGYRFGFGCEGFDLYVGRALDGSVTLSRYESKAEKTLGTAAGKLSGDAHTFRIRVKNGDLKIFVDGQAFFDEPGAAGHGQPMRHLYIFSSWRGETTIHELGVAPAE
ncbi:MAG: DUF1080 domain-containing protein [Planctomycetota bacterium]|nr:DUF1080 domain-containing protein [Planctomycetota bacterium]